MLDPVCLTNIFKKCLKDEGRERHRKDSVGGAAFRIQLYDYRIVFCRFINFCSLGSHGVGGRDGE